MKVSLIQMNSGFDVDLNMHEAHLWIKEAADQKARLVVLPEMFACLGVSNQHQLALKRFTLTDILAELGKWAKRYNLFLIAGSLPMLVDNMENAVGERVFAASLLFDPTGNIKAQYNKIHLFDVDVEDEKGRYRESDTFYPGITPVTAVVDDQTLGMSVCYDLRFPALYQNYMDKDCSLISVPSAFTYQTGQKHWEILLRARAIETQSFILAANQGGLHEDGRQTWGHSMIVSPDGEILASLKGQDSGIVSAELNFEFRREIKGAMPLQQHKRLFSKD